MITSVGIVGMIICSQGQAWTGQECVVSTPFRFMIITSSAVFMVGMKPFTFSLFWAGLLVTCSVLPFCQWCRGSVGVVWADSGRLAMIPCVLPPNSCILLFTFYSFCCASWLFVAMLSSFVTSIICLPILFHAFSYLIYVSRLFLCLPFLPPTAPTLHSSCLVSYSDQTSHCTWWKAHFFSGLVQTDCIAVQAVIGRFV